jgi:hypothetical protein
MRNPANKILNQFSLKICDKHTLDQSPVVRLIDSITSPSTSLTCHSGSEQATMVSIKPTILHNVPKSSKHGFAIF